MNLTSIDYNIILNRLKISLQDLLESRANQDSISEKYVKVLDSLEEFFSSIEDPYTKPVYLEEGNPALSEEYNSNLKKIYQDLQYLYSELEEIKSNKILAYNFSNILVSEVTSKAGAIASTVLDLSILSNFTRGDTIVAGDDFKNLSYIDSDIGLGSAQAELVYGSSGIGLARSGSNDISESIKSIEVIPLAPVSLITGGEVNVQPTPGNFKRFYEGNYYNLLGLARPEGGAFNIRYQMRKRPQGGDDGTGKFRLKRRNDGSEVTDDDLEGFFTDYGATKEEKRSARFQMLDQSPSTFWECEYVYKIRGTVLDKGRPSGDRQPINERGSDGTSIGGGSKPTPKNNNDDPEDNVHNIVIDLEKAEQIAKQYDFVGRDLIVDVVLTFKQPQNVNFLAINPMIFGVSVFPYIEDISTADLNNGQFITVDGWNSLRFPKTITPEANEFLTDSQLGASLAPNRYEYAGQGIYPFPVRFTDKVKIRMRVDSPVPQIYERISILLKRHIDLDITVTTTTTRYGF